MKPKAQLPAGSHFLRHSTAYSPTAATSASAHHPPNTLLHSWQLQDTQGLLSIPWQLALSPSSMRQPSTYNILQKGALQITTLCFEHPSDQL